MNVYFENVGRNKGSWSIEVPDGTNDEIMEALIDESVNKNARKYLMSHVICWELDLDTGTGHIYAGMRPVGSIRVKGLTPMEVTHETP